MIKISKTSKTSESFYHFCKDKPKNPISNPESFKFKSRILHSANNTGVVDAEISQIEIEILK